VEIIQSAGDVGNRYIIRNDKGQLIKAYDYKGNIEVAQQDPREYADKQIEEMTDAEIWEYGDKKDLFPEEIKWYKPQNIEEQRRIVWEDIRENAPQYFREDVSKEPAGQEIDNKEEDEIGPESGEPVKWNEEIEEKFAGKTAPQMARELSVEELNEIEQYINDRLDTDLDNIDIQQTENYQDKLRKINRARELSQADDKKTTVFKELTDEFQELVNEAEEEGIKVNLENYDLPLESEGVDVIEQKYRGAIDNLQQTIEQGEQEKIISKIQEKAETRIDELEDISNPSRKNELEYRIWQAREGEDVTSEDIRKKLRIVKSGKRNDYGDFDERKNMINQIIDQIDSDNAYITVDTPGGTMEIINEPEKISDIIYEMGGMEESRPLKGQKIKTVKPEIDENQIKKDQYYAQFGKGEFIPVIGAKPFGIEETKGLDLFRYKPSKQLDDFPISTSGWVIADAKSGYKITEGRTIQDAAKNLKKVVEDRGAEEIARYSDKAVEEEGISPRYGGNLSEEGQNKEKKIYEARREISKRQKRQDPEKVPDAEPVTRQEIEEYINVDMGIKYDYGKITSSRAVGQYKVDREVIRTRDLSDEEITGHEMGHHISKKLDLNVKDFPELKNLLEEEGLAESYPEELHHEEGAAEFFKYYFTDPSVAVMKAPDFASHLEKKLQDNPELNDQVKNLQNMMVRWEQQTARDRQAGSMTKRPSRQRRLLTLKDKLVKKWVAEDKVLQRVLEEAGYDWEEDLEITENPVKLRRLFASVNDKIHTFLTKKTLDPYGKLLMDSLLDILKPVEDYIGEGNEVGDLGVYGLSLHALEREARYIAKHLPERQEELKQDILDAIQEKDIDFMGRIIKEYAPKTGRATGMRPDDIVEIVNKYDSDLFRSTLEKLDKYQNNLVDYLVHRDMINREQGEAIKSAYSFHLSLYRLFGAGEGSFEGTGGNKYANLPNPLKKAYGSTRIIKDPIRSIIQDTAYIIRQADKNRIALSLTKAVEKKEGTGWLVEDVPLPEEPHKFALEQVKNALKEAGLEDADIDNLDLDTIATVFETRYYATIKEDRENVVLIRENGRIKAKQLHPELYEFMQQTDVGTSALLRKLLKPLEWAGSAFKIAAVYDPGFWINNLGRDEFREATYSENGIAKLNLFKTVIDGMRGLTGMSKEETDALFRAAGGSRAGFFGLIDDLDNPNAVNELLSSKDMSWNPLDYLGAASRWTEDTRRKGFFVQDLEDVDLGELSPEEFEKRLLEAGYQARGGILEDYGIKGELGREFDRYFASFYSAGTTGARHMYNKFKNKPIMTLLKMFGFITVPTMMLYMRNRDKEAYQELPAWRKMYFYHYVTDKGTVIPFPKPFLPGMIFGAIPEMYLNYLDEKDPEIVGKTLKNLIKFGAPNFQPSHIIPYVELMFNRKLESGIDIVPESEKYLKPEEQYSKWTSEPAKLLGNITGTSPRKIDHLIRGQFPSLGSSTLEIINFVSGAQDFKETMGAVLGLYNEPFTSSVSIDKLYKERDKARTIVDTAKEQIKSGQTEYTKQEVAEAYRKMRTLNEATSYLADLRRAENILDREDIPENVKESVTTYLNIKEINVARQALGKPQINPADYMDPKEVMRAETILKNLRE
ncbi:MAG: LPD38 domain-containing protein, partial [Halanaerobiales bacterium]